MGAILFRAVFNTHVCRISLLGCGQEICTIPYAEVACSKLLSKARFFRDLHISLSFAMAFRKTEETIIDHHESNLLGFCFGISIDVKQMSFNYIFLY